MWQRLQFIVHSSAPESGSAFTDTVVSVFVFVAGVGDCAVAGRAMIPMAAALTIAAAQT